MDFSNPLPSKHSQPTSLLPRFNPDADPCTPAFQLPPNDVTPALRQRLGNHEAGSWRRRFEAKLKESAMDEEHTGE